MMLVTADREAKFAPVFGNENLKIVKKSLWTAEYISMS